MKISFMHRFLSSARPHSENRAASCPGFFVGALSARSCGIVALPISPIKPRDPCFPPFTKGERQPENIPDTTLRRAKEKSDTCLDLASIDFAPNSTILPAGLSVEELLF